MRVWGKKTSLVAIHLWSCGDCGAHNSHQHPRRTLVMRQATTHMRETGHTPVVVESITNRVEYTQ